MTGPPKPHRYLLGIEYESPHEGRGFLELKRRGTLKEVARELYALFTQGHSYPAFPPHAHPGLLYAWDLEDPEDGDCYPELMAALQRVSRMAAE